MQLQRSAPMVLVLALLLGLDLAPDAVLGTPLRLPHAHELTAAATLTPLQRRQLFSQGDSTCTTFCGAGRPCTPACQQHSCANCGGGGGGASAAGYDGDGGDTTSSGTSASTTQCPDDSTTSCSDNCACPSGQQRLSYNKGTCFTCKQGGSAGPPPPPSQCPDDSTTSCSDNCACPSGQQRLSYNKGTCFTCKQGGGQAPPPPPAQAQCPDDASSHCSDNCACPAAQRKMSYNSNKCFTCKRGTSSPPPAPSSPTPPPTAWPWHTAGVVDTKAAAQKYCAAFGETQCYNTPDCGYCIAQNYDSGCVPGDKTGPWQPISTGSQTMAECAREWQAGVHRTAASMCVTVVKSGDVRCYKDCMGGGAGMQQFVVPNQATCLQYDSAYKAAPAPAATRQGVQQHVTGTLLKHAMLAMHVDLLRDAGHTALAEQAEQTGTFQFYHPSGAHAEHDDATVKLLSAGLRKLEDKGLSYVEDAACGATAVIGPEGPLFCDMLFNSPVGTWINNKIESIPLVKQATHWIASTCANILPSGLRSAADDVIDVYNEAKKVASGIESVAHDITHPVQAVESAVASAGKSIANAVFGWL